MKKKARIFILLILVVVLMVSSGFFLHDVLQSRAEEEANDELADEVNRLRESVRAASLAAEAAAPAVQTPAAPAASSAAPQTTVQGSSTVTGPAAADKQTSAAGTEASAAVTQASSAGTQTSSAGTQTSPAGTGSSPSAASSSSAETTASAAGTQSSAAGSTAASADTQSTAAASTTSQPKQTTQAAATTAAAAYDPNMLPQYAPLYARNNDLAGWLTIDGTKIDYAVMYTPDNIEKYIHKGFNGKYAAGGSLFLGDGWFAGSNYAIIYGHHMKNGTMFSSLTNYTDASFAASHPVIRFDTLYQEREYEVVCAFYSKVYGEDEPDAFRYYAYVTLPTQEIFDGYMQQVRAIALYDTGVSVSYGDSLLVLSTCSYHTTDGRFAVLARRR